VLKTGQNNTDQNSPIERRKMYKESERLWYFIWFHIEVSYVEKEHLITLALVLKLNMKMFLKYSWLPLWIEAPAKLLLVICCYKVQCTMLPLNFQKEWKLQWNLLVSFSLIPYRRRRALRWWWKQNLWQAWKLYQVHLFGEVLVTLLKILL
jgi:hypothetical protein